MHAPFMGTARAEWPDGRAAVLYAPARVQVARRGASGVEIVTVPAAWESDDSNLAELLNDILASIPNHHHALEDVAKACLEYFLAPPGGAVLKSTHGR